MKQLIRLACSTDAPAIQAIYAPYVEQTAISFEIVPPTISEIRTRIKHTLPGYPWLVSCDRHGDIVGYAYAGPHSSRQAYQWSVDVSVYIHQQYHRQGIGHILYTELFALLRQQSFYNVYAGITLPNVASVSLHEAMGLCLIGVYKNVGYKQGVWRDVGWWGSALQELVSEPPTPKSLAEVIDLACWSPSYL